MKTMKSVLEPFRLGWLPLLFLGLQFLTFPFAGPASAGPGDLLVSPVRVVLEGRERSAEVTLVNRGAETATYRVSVQNRRMLEDGRFEDVVEPRADELTAEEMIRYAPRRVTLDPNRPQTIRVVLRKPRGLEDGEYRSHILFRAMPDADAGESIELQGGDDSGLAIRLIPVYGVSIPVIVRQGDLAAEVSFGGTVATLAATDDSPPSLSLEINRDGNRSVYGDIVVSLPDRPDEEGVIGLVRGIAVYTPNRKRRLLVPIDPTLVEQLRGREIEVAFNEVTAKGDPQQIARERIRVQ